MSATESEAAKQSRRLQGWVVRLEHSFEVSEREYSRNKDNQRGSMWKENNPDAEAV